MNCTKCNTYGERIIDGLCHSCTAKLKNEWCLKYTELAELYSKTADELKELQNLFQIEKHICREHTNALRLAASQRCPVCDMIDADSRLDSCRNLSELVSELRDELQRYKNLVRVSFDGCLNSDVAVIGIHVPLEKALCKTAFGKLGDLEL